MNPIRCIASTARFISDQYKVPGLGSREINNDIRQGKEILKRRNLSSQELKLIAQAENSAYEAKSRNISISFTGATIGLVGTTLFAFASVKPEMVSKEFVPYTILGGWFGLSLVLERQIHATIQKALAEEFERKQGFYR